MSDRVKLAREIAARTEPRFIEIKPDPRRKSSGRFIEISRERGAAGRFAAFMERGAARRRARATACIDMGSIRGKP